MTLDLQRAASQRMRRIVIGLVVLVLILVGGIIGLVFGGGHGGGSSPVAAPSSTPLPSTSFNPSQVPDPLPTETTGGGYVAPTTWVTLPTGSQKKDGLPVGFPHTPEGAAAAAVAAVRAGWTWNPDAAATAADVYAVPGDAAQLEQAARQATQNSRISVGLPATGALPADASMAVAPIGVQWTGATADQVTVSVLARVVYTPGGGTAQKTQVMATASTLVWAGGDWHTALGASNSATAPEPFDLGTAGFNSAGWRAIQQGDSQ